MKITPVGKPSKLLKVAAGDSKKCPECEGGYIEGNCSLCSGSGEGNYSGSGCSKCKGSGSEAHPCPECDGSGKVSEASGRNTVKVAGFEQNAAFWSSEPEAGAAVITDPAAGSRKSPQDIGAKVKVAMPTWHPDSDPLPEEETMPGHQWQGGFLVEGPGKGNLPYEVSGMATTEKSPEPEMMAIAHCWTSKDAQKIADALNAT
jgi:hypothetical protein